MSHTQDPTAESPTRLDWNTVRERLQQHTGRTYWRSLDELADSENFQSFLHAEFPQEASILSAVGRRQFLQLMGASMALAGLSACTRQPEEKIVPYVKAPEQIVPGEPLYFASAMPTPGGALGVLVESHMGRPTKVEGNPDHPTSLGATDVFTQASILDLYDPDRSQVVRSVDEIRPWASFVESFRGAVEAQRANQGRGLRILTETVTSPTLAEQLRQILTLFPEAKWHQYEPCNQDAALGASVQCFGEAVHTAYHFDKADVVVSLGGDFLAGPNAVRATKDFTRRRRPSEQDKLNRLYVVEPTPTLTGAIADHRLPLRQSDMEAFAHALGAAAGLPLTSPSIMAPHQPWIAAVAADLRKSGGRSIVIAGPEQPAAVHVVAHHLNHALGNVGTTVTYTESLDTSQTGHLNSLRNLVVEMDAGNVAVLVILGGNPVYTTPADLKFVDSLKKVALRVHLSGYDDETSRLCNWHIPAAHYLESWSDVRSQDGTISIIQPLIAPLYSGKTAHEVLALLTDPAERPSHDIVKDHWKVRHPGPDFDHFWRRILHDGSVPDTAFPTKSLTPNADALRALAAPGASSSLDLLIRADSHVFDGRYANNGWLQELPKPMTKLTWDNTALIAPATAERLGLQSQDVVELKLQDRSVRAPVWVLPGQAPDTVTVHLGYGRTRAGRVGNGAGFNAYLLQASGFPWNATGLEVHKTGEQQLLACTQDHSSMEGRDIIRTLTLDEYEHGHEGQEKHEEMSLYPAYPSEGYAWAMSIDLSACVGCNACTIACQAENNIPIVGREQVGKGREMHWIRVDRYFEGDVDNPSTHHQPVPCMQCENAPCEVVCPVNATVHSSEGLNDMVYNRCVGTKYCSNNCPYKVRRFNFFKWNDTETESLKLQRNPDVTVRSYGVMEKCTYCVQRINYRRIQAKKEDRKIRDGEIVTACQQVCPADAIVFGSLHDPKSRVSELREDKRNYALLEELNTRPRTTYLAALRNPNPELGGKGKA